MGYASKLGRARISARNPRAAAQCDRCGFIYNHVDLSWQYDWAGASLINKRILVCESCNDVPQQQLRAIVVPPDPVPIMNPRVQDYQSASDDIRITEGNTINSQTGIPVPGGDTRITQNDQVRVTQQTGGTPFDISEQPGLDQNAVMPLQGNTPYAVSLPLLSVVSDGAGLAIVVCSSNHNLATDAQISVEGLSEITSNGFYTITVLSSTSFSYQLNPVLAAGSLLTSTTKMITANAGLPYNNEEIPQTGPL